MTQTVEAPVTAQEPPAIIRPTAAITSVAARVVLGAADLVPVWAALAGAEILSHDVKAGSYLAALRLLLGAAWVFILPGYCLCWVMFPGRGQLSGFERSGLVVALSMTHVGGVGLTLSLLRIHITGQKMFLAVAALTLFWSAVLVTGRVAWARVYDLPANPFRGALSSGADRLSSLVVAALLLFAGGAVAYAIGNHHPAERYVEFGVVNPAGGKAVFPGSIKGSLGLTVSVANRQGNALTSWVRISAGSHWLATKTVPDLRIGHTWRYTFHVTPPASRVPERINISLLAQPHAAPYRQLHLWVTASGGR